MLNQGIVCVPEKCNLPRNAWKQLEMLYKLRRHSTLDEIREILRRTCSASWCSRIFAGTSVLAIRWHRTAGRELAQKEAAPHHSKRTSCNFNQKKMRKAVTLRPDKPDHWIKLPEEAC